MIRRFTSGPNPRSRVLRYISRKLALGDSQAVADPVVSGEVRAGFSRGDNIISGDRIARVRHLQRDSAAAQLFEEGDPRQHLFPHLGIEALAEIVLRDADSHALQAASRSLAA